MLRDDARAGVFGILAYSIQQHVRDFGVRRALGAKTNDILRLVIGNAARVIAAGAAIGLVLAIVSGRMIETMLFGVRPLDLATFAVLPGARCESIRPPPYGAPKPGLPRRGGNK